MFIDIIKAQPIVWDQLAAIFKSGRIGTAYCFTGPPGCGKEGLALTFTALMNCENNNSFPNCECFSCLRFKTLQHEHLNLVVPLPTPTKKNKDYLDTKSVDSFTEELAKKKAEEEAKRTYEEELEEQLTEEQITDFQIHKTDMDKLINHVCEIAATYGNNGIHQSDLWKKLKLTSRDGSRLALKLERMGLITREKILLKGRWTYKLIIVKSPIGTESLEGAPCLVCPVESKCSLDGEISPKTCQFIEDWVLIELKTKKSK